MAVNKKSLQNLEKGKATRFSSDKQPENPGRKPSALRFIRDESVSITDIKRIIGSLIWEYDSEELGELLKTKDVKITVKGEDGKTKTETKKVLIEPVPLGVQLVLNALLDDMKNKCLNNFEKLMDRSHGKPEKTIKHGITAIDPDVMAMLDEAFSEKPEPKPRSRKPKT